MNTRLFLLVISLSIIFINASFSQNYTLSGYVKDTRTGETLIGVNVFNKASVTQGTSTNNYGFFSLTMPQRNS